MWPTSGAQDSVERRASDYVGSTTRVTVSPAWAASLASGVTYELWMPAYRPSMINDLINDAIIDIYGAWYDPEEDLTLALSGKTSRLVIPGNLAILQKVYIRDTVSSIIIHDCDTVWNDSVDSDITVTLSLDAIQGQSVRMQVAAAAAANDIATDNIGSLDLREYDFIEFWCKSNIATVAGDIHIRLDDTLGGGSPIETLAVPALVADRWTHVRVAFTDRETLSAIVNVQVRFTADNGAQYFWIDRIQAVKDDTAVWIQLPWRAWSVDKEAGELVINDYRGMGMRLLKIIGGDEPPLLSADTDQTEVTERYIIPWVAARALQFTASRTGNRELLADAAIWEARAMRAKMNFPPLTNRRYVG